MHRFNTQGNNGNNDNSKIITQFEQILSLLCEKYHVKFTFHSEGSEWRIKVKIESEAPTFSIRMCRQYVAGIKQNLALLASNKPYSDLLIQKGPCKAS